MRKTLCPISHPTSALLQLAEECRKRLHWRPCCHCGLSAFAPAAVPCCCLCERMRCWFLSCRCSCIAQNYARIQGVEKELQGLQLQVHSSVPLAALCMGFPSHVCCSAMHVNPFTGLLPANTHTCSRQHTFSEPGHTLRWTVADDIAAAAD